MNKHTRTRAKSLKTIIRDNMIHDVDDELRAEFGDAYYDMSRDSIYRRIAQRTGLCTKKIAETLNHTAREKIPQYDE